MTRNRHIQLLTIEYAANAIGVVKTHSYEQVRGLLLGTTYSDGTTARTYAYNHHGQLTQVVDDDGFLHGGTAKNFGYTYLAGTNLLQTLTKPNGMTLTQSYEAQRDLLTGMAYHRGSTLVAQREYTYDVLRRPTARTTSRQGNVVNDTFVHNTRSELASAQVNGEAYGYDYDNIGNRRMSMEAGDYAFYEANELNQYTDITGSEDEADFSFTPVFDADGNQTSIKTETGIWTAVYNAENRPVSFTNEATGTVVTCAYDSMGRRSFKKVTVNGTVTLHQRYLYRGYLQIACIDLTRSHHPALWLVIWDPTQPVATRPLATQKGGTWYTYGIDLTKNVCEVFGSTGYIATTYTYSPYGSVTATGSVTQPIQWSSEMWDSELELVYYNWRYYNSKYGDWSQRDIKELDDYNIYKYVINSPIQNIDNLGLLAILFCNRYYWNEYNKQTDAITFRFGYVCVLAEFLPLSTCCEKNYNSIMRAKTSSELVDAIIDTLKCIGDNNNNSVTAKLHGPIFSNLGRNEVSEHKSDEYSTNGPLPPRDYRVLPKPESQMNYTNEREYEIGTPSLTDLNRNAMEAGYITSPSQKERKSLRIHGAGYSQGCLSMENGAENLITTKMNEHSSFGGLYATITNCGFIPENTDVYKWLILNKRPKIKSIEEQFNPSTVFSSSN